MIQRCHYEVLGIERTATEEEIKKAHRKQSLLYHPDKAAQRGEDIEKAHIVFQEIQSAYECLIDSHERKWYDSHREDILRGGNVDTSDDEESPEEKVARREVNLWSYFSTAAYDGFNGGDRSFYPVYQKAFQMIINAEQKEIFDYVGADFGTCDSDWDQVKAFYDEFIDFQSPRSFAAYDRWKIDADMPRHIRRAAEADNKRRRKAAKQCYQEMVRQLAQYCRKRDPRVAQRIAHVAAEKEAKQKAALLAKSKQRAQLFEARQKWRQEEEDPSFYQVRTGALLADLDDDNDTGRRKKKAGKPKKKSSPEDDDSNDDQTPDSQSVQDNNLADDKATTPDPVANLTTEDVIFACNICKKTFKSEQQLENHLQSKAHKKKAAKS
eukprot:CAMPEP_0197317892 /NCGR_PEP_ID=MMETSP0891-20130614/49006_1 /TAXON_ID=44058 ORGANISM="Aureoumbra lagunensis, Strain CCMP1510" /NCGR_SAMPLE_ID=MMETSP0891 /ASSEMBLY_ACC=CAM_ASM_000534 /LENGTH=380 /DNA_ID=CAMNT_0042808095 /DNA_START=12 /DNA_END=1154 /DNA_ORIENTATION=+